jgi:uncharacterized protein YjbI with pentapeptide repeats
MTKPRFPSVIAPRLPTELVEITIEQLESDDTFEEAVITGSALATDAEYVELTSARVSNVAFTASVFQNLSFVDVLVEDSEFSGVSFEDSTMTRVEFRQCRLTGMSAPGLKARDVRFVHCKIDSANFHMSNWERCEFVDCELEGAEFNAATLTATRFRDCQMNRSEFSRATFNDVAFHGSTLDVIGGADGMRGAVIGSGQVAALATSVFSALGIKVNDEV